MIAPHKTCPLVMTCDCGRKNAKRGKTIHPSIAMRSSILDSQFQVYASWHCECGNLAEQPVGVIDSTKAKWIIAGANDGI